MTQTKPDDALIAAARKAFAAEFGAMLKLVPKNGEPIWIDGRQAPPVVSPTPLETSTAPACTWRGARETLLRVLSSERAFESAFVSGRVSVSGDMSVMARLELGARQ
ncbi:MAG: SCP2 sterol-binding domain-containing protein [Pseudomonadota bacterium]